MSGTIPLMASVPASLAVELASKPISATDVLLFSPTDLATSPFLTAPDPISTSIHLLSSLFFVIVLIFGVSWLVQKKAGLGRSTFGKVLGILPLDSKRFIYVTDVLNRVLVLGVTEQQITLLCEVTDKATIDALRLSQQSASAPGLESVFGFLKRKRSEEITPEDLTRHTENIQNNRQRIQDLLLKNQEKEHDLSVRR
ncbi:MAG TPA: flagellar biosynthetic protein FliO, partial [Candidatus Ozemobacteraceae bacterium]|nr:flagellar biosynthetic protein FliO [Candidatus Ozemobacteraceae bacterium]